MKHAVFRALLGALALAASLFALPAAADTVRFHLTDGENTLVWFLPLSPTPDDWEEDESFDIDGPVFGRDNGEEIVFLGFSFFTGEFDGGFSTAFVGGFPSEEVSSFDEPYFVILNLLGPQLFTGPVDAPTFTLGTFELIEEDCTCDLESAAIGDFTLTISAGVPEPATWALMIGGFGAAGVALRNRRRAIA